VVALVRSGCVPLWDQTVRAAYYRQTGLDCDIVVCRPGDGAGLVSV
jgi:galactokinase